MENLQECLNEVKGINWNEAVVSFYLVKRRLVQREAKYKVLQVNIDDNLRSKLRRVANNKVVNSNQALEYNFNTTDLDDNLLSISTDETDLKGLIESIISDDIPMAESYDDLLNSWIYISRLEKNDKILYAVRQISDSWKTKKVTQFSINMIFNNNMLVDIEQEDILRIDGKVDFFSFDGIIFISDKKNFETAMNFREGMERNRDEIVQEFTEQNLFVDANEITNLVGNNIHRLRKLSQVKKSGYYRQQDFLRNLQIVNEQENWGIEYSDEGKLIVNENSIDTILTVLNNSRLKSPINQESFDVDSKHKLENTQN